MSVRRQNKSVLVLLITALMAVVSVIGCADLKDDTQIADAEVRDAFPTQEFRNVEMSHTEDGELVFILRTEILNRYDKQDEAILIGGVEIEFYEEGEVSSILTSDRGEVLKGGNELIAIGNVVVTTDTGSTILSPLLRWTRDDALITSDTTVTIITKWDTLTGTGLIATEDLKTKRILRPTGSSARGVQEPVDSTDTKKTAIGQE